MSTRRTADSKPTLAQWTTFEAYLLGLGVPQAIVDNIETALGGDITRAQWQQIWSRLKNYIIALPRRQL